MVLTTASAGLAEDAEGAFGFVEEGWIVFEGEAGLEHGRVEGGFAAGEGQVGAAAVLDGFGGVWAAVVVAVSQILGKTLEAPGGRSPR